MISMESIIQISVDLARKISKMVDEGELKDLDSLAAHALEECKRSVKEIIEIAIQKMNQQLREDKESRKERGWIIHEKDRPREQLTALGLIQWTRDYYYDKKEGCYITPLDKMIGIEPYARIGNTVGAELVNAAADMSYAKSADFITGGAVSRQSVRNQILRVSVPESQPKEEGKKVKELHIYADEDHVHMQRPGKEKGKQNQIVPLVTITEGTESAGTHRNRTISPVSFVDEDFSGSQLWKTAEGYILRAYDIDSIGKIYIHGDGGAWIRNGLNGFTQVEHVMDGYHFYKELRAVARKYPARHVQVAITNAIRKDDPKRVEEYLRSLEGADKTPDKSVCDFQAYLFNNWTPIRNRLVLKEIPGSCTEGQVSHVLSERFSRNPMGWSREALGRLSRIRVYRINGGTITAQMFEKQTDSESYADYADRLIEEAVTGKLDWSIFEHSRTPFDGNSGTQHLMRILCS